MFNMSEPFFLNQMEEVRIMCDSHKGIKIRIPKLMPLLNSEECIDSKRSFNTKIFANTIETQPNPNSVVKCRNYITVNKVDNSIVSANRGDTGVVLIMDRNIDNLILTNIVSRRDK